MELPVVLVVSNFDTELSNFGTGHMGGYQFRYTRVLGEILGEQQNNQ